MYPVGSIILNLIICHSSLVDVQNPTWKTFEPERFRGQTDLSAQRLVVRVWGKHVPRGSSVDLNNFELLLEWDVDFRGLSLLSTGQVDEDKIITYSENSLIFCIRGVLYWVPPTPEMTAPLNKPNQTDSLPYSRADRTKVRNSYSQASLLRILQMNKSIRVAQAEKERMIAETEELLVSQGSRQALLVKRERLLSAVGSYRNQLASKCAQIEAVRAALEKLHAKFETDTKVVEMARVKLDADREKLQEATNKVRELSMPLQQIQAMVIVRQTRIVLELNSIYPLKQVMAGATLPGGGVSPGNVFSICNYELPNSDFTGADDDLCATALGYVAHLVFMLSKYLDIPFRYSITPMCSRSTIRDDISLEVPGKPKEYPLYVSKGKDRVHFEFGVFLLNKNIQQLIENCTSRTVDVKNTLPNLRLLLVHFMNLNQQIQTQRRQ